MFRISPRPRPGGLRQHLDEDRGAALADVGGGGVELHHAVVAPPAWHRPLSGQAHAHAGVLHGAGDARPAGIGLIGLLHRQQGLLQGGGAVGDLAVGQHLARLDGVAVADLPGGDAHLLGQQVDVGLQGELALAHAEAAEGPAGRVVGVVADSPRMSVFW